MFTKNIYVKIITTEDINFQLKCEKKYGTILKNLVVKMWLAKLKLHAMGLNVISVPNNILPQNC